MARNEQWVMLEKLFDAKLGPMAEDIRDIKSSHKAMQVSVDMAYNHAEDAHKEIAKYRNRLIGWMVGSAGTGSAFGVWLGKTWPSLLS